MVEVETVVEVRAVWPPLMGGSLGNEAISKQLA